jgi:thiosulfate dehydrogenase (quinone) large subunit
MLQVVFESFQSLYRGFDREMKTKTENIPDLSNWQWASMVILRVLIGWHLLYEGMLKLFDPNWSSAAFLKQSTWIFSDLFLWIADSPSILSFVDFLNQWALCLIGVALIAGLFSRTAAITGSIILLLYYLVNPPLFSQNAIMSTNEHTIIINKLLIETVALFAIGLFPTGKVIGLDLLIARFKSRD